MKVERTPARGRCQAGERAETVRESGRSLPPFKKIASCRPCSVLFSSTTLWCTFWGEACLAGGGELVAVKHGVVVDRKAECTFCCFWGAGKKVPVRGWVGGVKRIILWVKMAKVKADVYTYIPYSAVVFEPRICFIEPKEVNFFLTNINFYRVSNSAGGATIARRSLASEPESEPGASCPNARHDPAAVSYSTTIARQ